MEASKTCSLSKCYLGCSWKRKKPKNIELHVKQPQLWIFPIWEWERRFNEQEPFLTLIAVISKTHISVSGPAKTFSVFRTVLWFMVVGPPMTLGFRDGFSSKLHSGKWVQESLNLWKTLCVVLTPLRKGQPSFSQGRTSGGCRWGDVLQILHSSPAVRSCSLSSHGFMVGTLPRLFWPSHMSCSDSGLPRDHGWAVLLPSCFNPPAHHCGCQLPPSATLRLNQLDWLWIDKLDGDTQTSVSYC